MVDELPEFAELYTFRERVRMAVCGAVIGAAVILSWKLWLLPAFKAFIASAPCRTLLGVSGTSLLWYGLFVGLPLSSACILGLIYGHYGLRILRDGQAPPVGAKVLRPTRIRRGAAARRIGYLCLLAPTPLLAIAVWGYFAAQSLPHGLNHAKCTAGIRLWMPPRCRDRLPQPLRTDEIELGAPFARYYHAVYGHRCLTPARQASGRTEEGPLDIRPMLEFDAPAMLAIYRPYVQSSAVSFEAQVPSSREYTERVRKYLSAWSGFVAESDGRLLGFAYGSAHRERAAYRWSVETTVYVEQGQQRRGIGRTLYERLLSALAELGYCNAYAGVTLPNAASVGLHQAVGFQEIGTFPRVGYKFGRWQDVAWFHLVLRGQPPAVELGGSA